VALVQVASGATEATTRTAIETTAADGDSVMLGTTAGNGVINIALTGASPILISNKALRIFSLSGNAKDCVFTAGGSNGGCFKVTNATTGTANRLEFEGIRMSGGGSNVAGLQILGTATKGSYANLAVRRCAFDGGLNSGILAAMPGNGEILSHFCIDDCTFNGAINSNVDITNGQYIHIQRCTSVFANKAGFLLTNCIHSDLRGCDSSNNNQTGTMNGQTMLLNSFVVLNGCNNFMVEGLDCQAMVDSVDDARQVKVALAISNCAGGSINGLSASYSSAPPQFVGFPGYAIAFLNGSRGIRRGTVQTTNFPLDNPFFFDRLTSRDAVTVATPWTNVSLPLAQRGFQTT